MSLILVEGYAEKIWELTEEQLTEELEHLRFAAELTANRADYLRILQSRIEFEKRRANVD